VGWTAFLPGREGSPGAHESRGRLAAESRWEGLGAEAPRLRCVGRLPIGALVPPREQTTLRDGNLRMRFARASSKARESRQHSGRRNPRTRHPPEGSNPKDDPLFRLAQVVVVRAIAKVGCRASALPPVLTATRL